MSKNKKNKKGVASNKRKLVKMQLLLLYGWRDLLTNEKIDSYEECSFHHIIKAEFGGEYNEDNGAVLLNATHTFLHNNIELLSQETFDLLTECMLLYKHCFENNHTDLVDQFQQEVQPKVLKLKNSYYHNRR